MFDIYFIHNIWLRHILRAGARERVDDPRDICINIDTHRVHARAQARGGGYIYLSIYIQKPAVPVIYVEQTRPGGLWGSYDVG